MPIQLKIQLEKGEALMGHSKNRSTKLTSTKLTMSTYPMLAFKTGAVTAAAAKTDDRTQSINVGAKMKSDRTDAERFYSKNGTNPVVPNNPLLYSYPFEARCCECHKAKYQYSVEFLHSVREKMYQYASNVCHSCSTLPHRANYVYNLAEWNENLLKYPRTTSTFNLLLHEDRYLRRTPRPITKIHHLKSSVLPKKEENSVTYPATEGDRSEEIMYQHKYGLVESDFSGIMKDRVTPRSTWSFKTLHKSATPPIESLDKLSRSIWEKFSASKQTKATFIKKMSLWGYLYTCIEKIPRLPKFELFLMGSTISGLAMEDSDLDMCIVAKDGPMYCDRRTESLENLLHVKQFIESIPSSSFAEILLICAKVPILLCRQSSNDTDIELSFNNYVGIRNTQLLHCYAQLDWRVRPLVLIVKLWAKHHHLNDPKNSTISSYSLTLMVINFLQCGVSPPVLPCLHEMYPEKFSASVKTDKLFFFEHVEPFATKNNENLGNLFLHFLEFYTVFDYAHYGLSVRTGTIIPVEECTWYGNSDADDATTSYLCIEEPFNLTNTAKSVHNGYVFEQIKTAFATSWSVLDTDQDLSKLFDEPFYSPLSTSSFKGYR